MNAFPDIKPFPAAQAAPPMGHNNPPLEEQVVIDLAEALATEGITKRISDLLGSATRAPEITSREIAGRYADMIKQMVSAGKAVEGEREKLNRPLLTAQRALKGRADAIVAPLQDAERAARAKVKKFDDEELAKERQRQKEAAAAAEAERQRLQKIEDDRAAAESREAEAVHVEPEPVEEAAPAPVQGDFGAKVVRTTTWKHEIISVRQLPDAILKHAKVVEAIDKVIAAQVRGGTREMKGVRIFPETGTTIR
ncbi:hypothetical protein [Sphingobium indicum]|uniref:Uncharacterized protein n=1 Tax=Sphingobium indicum (strain DSM 16412 / CCM 7286 / MTCC 6364 / B90A) TaxID=861109 RepID=A0A1L5BMJ9_SPHIB|nr:hypothetical protein [Sphingobium indicum]APL94115.1 hypothetical protein SIDU_06115 [Sphingobium indicum B90A]